MDDPVRGDDPDGVTTIAISDDGIGGADTARGSGLRGLADRVAAVGGRLDVDSPPGRGTTVIAQMPCVPASPDAHDAVRFPRHAVTSADVTIEEPS